MLTDMASLVSQLSLVADGMRIKISLSPSTSALHKVDLLTGFAKLCPICGSFPISMKGKTARLFGPGALDCVTVTVRVEVLTAMEVDGVVMLGVDTTALLDAAEIGTVDVTLLLIEIAGADVER